MNLKKGGDTAEIIGIKLSSTSAREVLREVLRRLKKGQKTFIVTPNPEFIVFAQKRPWFRKILNQADIAIPDGVGLVWASRYLNLRSHEVLCSPTKFWCRLQILPEKFLRNQRARLAKKRCPAPLNEVFVGSQGEASQNLWARRPKQRTCPGYRKEVIKERISGTDLMEELCREAANHGWIVCFLGGRPGVAKRALVVLQKRYPGLRGWAEAGPELKIANGKWLIANSKTPRMVSSTLGRDSSEVEKWIKRINQKKPDFLFVAFGMGKQEKFIWDHWPELKVRLAMGVGGALNYLSGEIPRAPTWMRKIGLEWLYRLLRQPRRWRRIWTAVFVFPFKVFLSSLRQERQIELRIGS